METSLLIAKLIGLPVLIAGAGMLLNLAGYRDMAKSFLNNEGLIYMSGALLAVAGTAIVVAHNRWSLEWTLLITIFGWFSLLDGAVHMTYPKWVASVGAGFIESKAMMWVKGVLSLVVGATLTYIGFSA